MRHAPDQPSAPHPPRHRRGPARTRVANACLLAHGVLRELGRWGRSGAVLHAAVDCLKQLHKLGCSG